MKKTMIALALAATTVSGSAMAWTNNGTGGNVEIGGNIQITPYSTPWEVMVGAPATTLDANITKGVSAVMIPVTKAIPVLGIRPKTSNSFNGDRGGINPRIDYNGAVQIDNFDNGVTIMDLPVMDADNPSTQIGAMEVPFLAAALGSYWLNGNTGNNAQYSIHASSAGSAFFGGVAKNSRGVVAGHDVLATLNTLSSEFTRNYNTNSAAWQNTNVIYYGDPAVKYSGTYGAGIQAGQNIKLTLTKPAANNVIKWKASLPVTVSYQ